MRRLIQCMMTLTCIAIASSCSEPVDPVDHATLDTRTEVGVLNYAYAMYQLEFDFDARVVSEPFPGMLKSELDAFNAFQGAAYGTGQTYKTLIPAGRIADGFLFNLGALVNYSNRANTLTVAQMILETEARGLNTAIGLVSTPTVVDSVTSLAAAAKGRANQVRSMLALDTLTVWAPLTPAEAMTALAPYYRSTFTVISR